MKADPSPASAVDSLDAPVTAEVLEDAAAPVLAETTEPTAKLDRRYVTAALMLVMVLASMEQTITSTAMPTIIGELHGLEHYAWVASVYLLACTVTMPLYGRLADALGRKRVILMAIALFLVGSGLAGGARSMGQLIAYRGLQGLGAGGIMPVVLTILGDIFTLKERARIQGFFSSVWGTAALAGPWCGAQLVLHFGWRSIFLVNFPLALIALTMLIWKYHDHEKPHSTDLDLPGVGSLAVGCAALLILASRLGPDGWPWWVQGILAVICILALALFVWHERRAANPIMPPALLLNRMIGPSLAGSLLLGIGFLSLDTFVPLYVQGGLGGDVSAAGRAVTPVMLTWALSGVVSAPMVVRFGFRRVGVFGSIVIVIGFVGLLVCAALDANAWVLTGVLALTGMGFGPASMSYFLAAQGAVAWQQRGIVTSGVQFVRTAGGAVGIGVLGGLLNTLIRPGIQRLNQQGITPATLLDPHLRQNIPAEVLRPAQHMIGAGLTWVFVAMVICAVGGVVATLFMSSDKPDHSIRRSEALEAMTG
jgi:MFS family permease